MIVPLISGVAKNLVISMLSERVVLRVLVMLSEWAAAKSTNSLDDRLVLEMKTKLKNEMRPTSDMLLNQRRGQTKL